METLTGGERAGVLLLSCVQTTMMAEVYGPGLVSSPLKFPEESVAAVDALLEMVATADLLAGEAPMRMARYLRVHATSLLVLLATVAVGLPSSTAESTRMRTRAANAWRGVWAAKPGVEPALAWLRRGEAASGVPCFPRIGERRISDLDILDMVRLPPFLARRAPAKPRKADPETAPAPQGA